MNTRKTTPTLGAALYFSLAALLAGYFTFAAVQGNHGIFQRVQIEAELATTRDTRDRLAIELALIENRTRRLSDDFLDLDLLDERARDVLGMMRADEIILR
jgi:cell division protein FtsB